MEYYLSIELVADMEQIPCSPRKTVFAKNKNRKTSAVSKTDCWTQLCKLRDIRHVASARRSGQEDFQRGTPPVSLASCSISPFLRACIITEWSSKDHETDSTGTSILIPLLLLNFNMRLHGNPTAWYLFLATAHFRIRISRRVKKILLYYSPLCLLLSALTSSRRSLQVQIVLQEIS